AFCQELTRASLRTSGPGPPIAGSSRWRRTSLHEKTAGADLRTTPSGRFTRAALHANVAGRKIYEQTDAKLCPWRLDHAAYRRDDRRAFRQGGGTMGRARRAHRASAKRPPDLQRVESQRRRLRGRAAARPPRLED